MTIQDNSFNQSVLQTFLIESREMLQEFEESLLSIERGEYDNEVLNHIFRCAHTIKGSSGMLNLHNLEHFTHMIENLLDEIRQGKRAITEDIVSLLLDCHDHIEHLLSSITEEGTEVIEKSFQTRHVELLKHLNNYIPQSSKKKERSTKSTAAENEQTAGPDDDATRVLNDCWHISLRVCENIFNFGMDPVSFVNYMNTMGEIKRIAVISDMLPLDDSFNPESCYLGFEIDYLSEITKKEIEDIFEFLRSDCRLRILPPRTSINDYIRLIDELPEASDRIGNILCQIGSLTRNELDEVISLQMGQHEEEVPAKPIGEIIVEEQMVQLPVINAALEKQKSSRIADTKAKTIRIDADKLDNLINLVGELVIIGASVKQSSENNDKKIMQSSVSTMSRLIDDIRDGVMNIRMVQIGETFKRFERVVRDLSKERNKEIDFIINGGDTELDKTLIEKMTDPLMHLIRNAIDHGISDPAEREASGKPRRGTISLNAYHETGTIVIEVKDDGNGLNKEKIRAKALARGLITETEEFTDNDIYQIIFEPGFSTADKVTNISGRGVGMDVVKKNIESLRGSILIDSQEGTGTSIKIHLPLTLSIIDGFMVTVGESFYVVPLDSVFECTEVQNRELLDKQGGNFINIRGDLLPFIDLRLFFHEDNNRQDIANIIIVEHLGRRVGLVVDQLAGELQTVIKPLGEVFSKLQWINGATILGTGEVAFILDIPRLIQGMDEHKHEKHAEKETAAGAKTVK